MDQCDVLIVGGGPAGSSCARRLRQTGLDVLILDKQEFPRDKVCAGWITPAVAEELQLDLDDYGRGRVLQPLTGFRTSLMGRPEVETRYPQAVSYGIRRCEFDHYLLERCGARTRLGETFKTMRRDGNDWVINDAIRAPLVIGAGGHFCPVARQLGARPGTAEEAVAAKEIEFALSPEQAAACAVRADTPELFFCEDLKGYGWVFRKGDYLNIGLGRQDKQRLGRHLEAFVALLKERGRIPADLPDRFHGHAYLLYGETPRRLLDDGVLLIGDAAGLAYAQSGEGIRPAIESGLMAAQLITGLNGDYRQARLQPYVDALESRFGPRDQAHKISAASLLPDSVKRFLAARLLASRWFARHLVLDRWFFHADQAPLRV
jgi:geranylgeranyl reductase family protein